jgi:LPXTG-motif cell wall-anchored protein
MRKLLFVPIAGLFAALLTAAPAAPAGAQTSTGNGTVTVVHGIPGLTVDVYVNGNLTLADFAPDTVTDSLSLPAGEYQLAIRPANAAADSAPALSGTATLSAGANASIVAHLDGAGQPKLSVFVNDASAIEGGTARLVVRHTAAAPAVDVLANGSPAFTNLTNPNEAKADLPAGTISAAVAAAGTTTPVLGPTDLTLAEGTATIVYAVGSLQDGSLKILSQRITGLGAQAAAATAAGPAPVAGELARTGSADVLWLVAVGAGLVATGVIVRRRATAG